MDDHPTCGLVFLLGCLGALVPEIYRLYQERWKLNTLRFSLGYFVLSAAYASVGGVMALYLGAANPKTAIYVGLTLDVTLSAFIRKRKPHTKPAQFLNDEESNIVHAIDQTPSEGGNIIKASKPKQRPFYNTDRK